ncbi:hemerythrin domain-containing protein [Nocardioides antri]|uniref:Hemerythrin domain-containing protein n=1 Tax=Nocardioides antri TaxID=2607659 RepID=A0A5B1M8D5_9ACTN|nr:hemerythrin domain-containing protein [Nocardioides antri]KAA1428798.1 hemerythrin domain-containing protein [Nocardioides antri]
MTTIYPEQLMLPGQAAAPGGPVDMTIMYLMHHAFRRDLDRFAATVPATPADDLTTWSALARRWDRFSEILHHHHSGEDAGIWPFLLERAHPAERQALHAMEAEHSKIDPLLASCGELFGALAGPVGDRSREELRAGLAVRLAETRELLGAHLRHEETEALVVLQRHMTQEDWERIEQEHFKSNETLGYLLYVVPWVAEGLSKQVLDGVFAEAGQGFRVVLWIGRILKFRRLERRAFRYAPA